MLSRKIPVAYVLQQPPRRILDHVQQALEAFFAAVIRIGHLALGMAARIAQEQLRLRLAARRRDATRSIDKLAWPIAST